MQDGYECPVCGESFDSAKGRGTHRRWNHDNPWEEKDRLQTAYWDELKSIPTIADEWDCGETTIEQWLDKHGIETRNRGESPKDAPWTDKDTLERLYWGEGMSRQEIADKLDCTQGDVRYNMEKHGIERRKHGMHRPDAPFRKEDELRKEYVEKERPVEELAEEWDISTNTIYKYVREYDLPRVGILPEDKPQSKGYSFVYERVDGKPHYFSIHRLVAYAHGKLNDIFDGDMHVHHKNGVKWHNSPENLEVLTPSEHMKLHQNDDYERE